MEKIESPEAAIPLRALLRRVSGHRKTPTVLSFLPPFAFASVHPPAIFIFLALRRFWFVLRRTVVRGFFFFYSVSEMALKNIMFLSSKMNKREK